METLRSSASEWKNQLNESNELLTSTKQMFGQVQGSKELLESELVNSRSYIEKLHKTIEELSETQRSCQELIQENENISKQREQTMAHLQNENEKLQEEMQLRVQHIEELSAGTLFG